MENNERYEFPNEETSEANSQSHIQEVKDSKGQPPSSETSKGKGDFGQIEASSSESFKPDGSSVSRINEETAKNSSKNTAGFDVRNKNAVETNGPEVSGPLDVQASTRAGFSNTCFANLESISEGESFDFGAIPRGNEQLLAPGRKEKERHSTAGNFRRRRNLLVKERDLETLCEASEKDSEKQVYLKNAEELDKIVKVVWEGVRQDSNPEEELNEDTELNEIPSKEKLPSLKADSSATGKKMSTKCNDSVTFPSILESDTPVEHKNKAVRKKGSVLEPLRHELSTKHSRVAGEEHKDECASDPVSKKSSGKVIQTSGKEDQEKVSSRDTDKSFILIDEFLVLEDAYGDLCKTPKNIGSNHSNCVEESIMGWKRRSSKKSRGSAKDSKLVDDSNRQNDQSSLNNKSKEKKVSGKSISKDDQKALSKRKKKSKDEGSMEDEVNRRITENEFFAKSNLKAEEKRSVGSKDGAQYHMGRKKSVYAKGSFLEPAGESVKSEENRQYLTGSEVTADSGVEDKGHYRYYEGMSVKRSRKFSRVSQTPIALHNYQLNECSTRIKSRMKSNGHRMRKYSVMSLPTDPRSMTPRSKKLFSLSLENTIIFRYSERPLSCMVDSECCYRSQTYKEQIEHHKTRHCSKLPYICAMCFDLGSKMAFETKDDLEDHEKTQQHEKQRDHEW